MAQAIMNPALMTSIPYWLNSSVIFNRAGRLISEVVSGEQLNAGANLVHWDGRGRDGTMVEGGIYLVAVEAFGERQVKPLAVVR